MTLVVDASAVVAALVDDGEVGRWDEPALRHGGLAVPHLMPFEAANVLRRAAQRGDISDDAAARLGHRVRRRPTSHSPRLSASR